MWNVILWVYICLLVAGGLVGFFLAKSKISLFASLAFAVALALCATGLLPLSWCPWLLGLLLVVFAIRTVKTRKFVPAGLMFALTAVTLAVRVWL
jgi:uncharacterized membrane protein (UPF0136 family)